MLAPVLAGDRIAGVTFGQPLAVVAARLGRLFGPPVGEYALFDEPNDRWRGFVASYLGFDRLRVRSHDHRVRDLDDLVGR